jgi:hypothetical protein
MDATQWFQFFTKEFRLGDTSLEKFKFNSIDLTNELGQSINIDT